MLSPLATNKNKQADGGKFYLKDLLDLKNEKVIPLIKTLYEIDI